VAKKRLLEPPIANRTHATVKKHHEHEVPKTFYDDKMQSSQ
jgi:hypothetical protein